MYSESRFETLAANPFVAAVVLAICGIIFLLALKDRRYVLLAYLLFLPLTSLPITGGRLAGIPGLSIQNIVIGMGLYAIFLTRSRNTRMDRNLRVALILYWIVVVGVVLHGLFYLDELTRIRLFADYGVYDYLRVYLIAPFLVWLSFVVAYRYAATSVDRATDYLRYFGIAILVYAVVALGSVAYYFTQFRDFNLVREMVGLFIGIHTNDFSFAFVMAAPFLIAGTLSKRTVPRRDRVLFWLTLIGVVIAVLFSYSRSAYVALALVTFGFALLSKRSLLWLLVPALAGLVLFGPKTVLERAEFGFRHVESRASTSNLDYLTSGRLGMAEAALEKITSDFGQTVFGGGRLTFPRATYDTFGVSHPHDAYLEALLDAGVIGFIPIIAIFFMIFARAIKGMRRMRASELYLFYSAATVSLGCYLLMGLSGRSFFPTPNLVFVWQVSGFVLGLLRYDMARATQQTQSAMSTRTSSMRNNTLQRPRASAGNSPKCVV